MPTDNTERPRTILTAQTTCRAWSKHHDHSLTPKRSDDRTTILNPISFAPCHPLSTALRQVARQLAPQELDAGL